MSVAFCKEANKLVDYTLDSVTETNRYTGKPWKALVTCPRCHRTGLNANVRRILPTDHGYAIVPHHYTRGDPG